MKNLLGAILCGGESRRMGSDKGLIEQDGKTWAGLVAEKLLALQIPVVISINELQYEAYSKLFASEELIVDNLDLKGPIKGLLSVHQKYPHKDILLMACDLIDMDETTLNNLIVQYRATNEFDFFVYQENFAEPFCAIYTKRGLEPVLGKAQRHSLVKFSFQTILDEGNTLRIPIINKSSFRNYNAIPGHHRESPSRL
jgi:molybdopterin-guanine dinucleotide biosynthesis protein A